MDEKESLDKSGSCHAEPSGWFSMLRGEELSKSVLEANASREAGEVKRNCLSHLLSELI